MEHQSNCFEKLTSSEGFSPASPASPLVGAHAKGTGHVFCKIIYLLDNCVLCFFCNYALAFGVFYSVSVFLYTQIS